MEIETSTLMMGFFLFALVVSIWKISAFLPNEQLADDDNTPEAKEQLLHLILKVLKEQHPEISHKELCEKVKEHEEFDGEHFWRFNENKLRQLLGIYHAKNPDTQSIGDIHKKLNEN